jgi:hypothetical protein
VSSLFFLNTTAISKTPNHRCATQTPATKTPKPMFPKPQSIHLGMLATQYNVQYRRALRGNLVPRTPRKKIKHV